MIRISEHTFFLTDQAFTFFAFTLPFLAYVAYEFIGVNETTKVRDQDRLIVTIKNKFENPITITKNNPATGIAEQVSSVDCYAETECGRTIHLTKTMSRAIIVGRSYAIEAYQNGDYVWCHSSITPVKSEPVIYDSERWNCPGWSLPKTTEKYLAGKEKQRLEAEKLRWEKEYLRSREEQLREDKLWALPEATEKYLAEKEKQQREEKNWKKREAERNGKYPAGILLQIDK